MGLLRLCNRVPVKEWRQTQSGRLEAVKPFKDDISFQSLNFYDISVGFYQPDEDGILGSEDLPEDNNWCFVELTETELERLVPPDNVLVSHILAVFANGEARYRAYGKHTDERFYTENSLCNRFWIYWRVMNLKISKQL